MDKFGFVRVTSATNRIVVANPRANRDEIQRVLHENSDSDIVLFPELSLSSYTAGNLFHQRAFLDACLEQVLELARDVGRQLVAVGIPVATPVATYNCVAVLNQGEVIGVVPKEFVPNYGEFREGLWFASAREEEVPRHVSLQGKSVPFGTNLLFECQTRGGDVIVGFDICEAIFMPLPPSSFMAIAGANVLLNPSASPENINKAEYRRHLVIGQSGRCIAAYAYASSGPTEATNDFVCGGHCLIGEAGVILAESERVGAPGDINRNSYWITCDIDVQKLQHERCKTTSFIESAKYIRAMRFDRIPFELELKPPAKPRRAIDAHPFVPKNPETLEQRCAEIVGIQVCGLAKRLETIGYPERQPPLSIGISGGLDSTHSAGILALTLDTLGVDRSVVQARTLPGFGTTRHTRGNADRIMDLLGFSSGTIDIRPLVYQHLQEIGHQPFGIAIADRSLEEFEALLRERAERGEDFEDLVFENAQARYRTMCLMDLGFVVGTGDLSELWLGWCTYNADQQSMYSVNSGVPKTLVAFLVRHMAANWAERLDATATGQLYDVMISVAETVISPELLPAASDGTIRQSTEDRIGPYEIHDFAMMHTIRNGYSPDKLLHLMRHATGWQRDYSEADFRKWLAVNVRRSFSQQYKRENLVDGPKVGSVCLSPRGDWVMPADADPAIWLQRLENPDAGPS